MNARQFLPVKVEFWFWGKDVFGCWTHNGGKWIIFFLSWLFEYHFRLCIFHKNSVLILDLFAWREAVDILDRTDSFCVDILRCPRARFSPPPLSVHPVVDGCQTERWGWSVTRKATGYLTSQHRGSGWYLSNNVHPSTSFKYGTRSYALLVCLSKEDQWALPLEGNNVCQKAPKANTLMTREKFTVPFS